MTKVVSSCQIILSGKITDISVQQTIVGIHNMIESGASEITLCIDSLGGSARDGFLLYDYISGLKVPVTGIVTGRAESMALVVLQACHKRLMMREATVLAHKIYAEPDESKSDLHKRWFRALIADYEERLITLFLEKTNLGSWELVEGLLDASTSLNAEQAKKLGLVDDIIDAHKT